MTVREKQLALFEPPAQRRRAGREEDRIFDAVRRLRKAGSAVYAAGRDHQVDGRLLTTPQLLAIAASL